MMNQNQKDYDEIAKIMCKQRGILKDKIDNLCNELADYFEKSGRPFFNYKTKEWEKRFNKEQFLKDCGL